jgi:2-keto-4-pentenoate hydratase/2-oxohepta-3-ene-1,7-dioic acid hydratase in catechol pathway
MKLCRFQPLEFSSANISRSGNAVHPEPRAGAIENGVVWEISGPLWDPLRGMHERTGRQWPLDEIKFLPPSSPSKIVCVGRNYLDHAKELGNEVPKEPLIFLKPPSAVIAPEEPIVLPRISERVDFEGELAVIIGRSCFHLGSTDDVKPFIAGYTCLNDVTARDLQKRDGQWSRAKGCDTFCPFGPVLETEPPPAATKIETFVNGIRKQSGSLAEMIFPVDVIIRWISQAMTLEPGDVIATGTPAGVGPLVAGDVVEVSISGLGTLRNPVLGFED